MAATSFGDVPLPLNNRMAGDPLDVERMAQAGMEDRRRPRDATTRIRRPAFTNESGLCDYRLAFIKVELIDGIFLNELGASVQAFHPERCQVVRVCLTPGSPGRRNVAGRRMNTCARGLWRNR
jgi:hypothetical protein